MMQDKVVLTIAGADSSGGAGIQADLKVFAELGCRGESAVTALTLQDAGHFQLLNPLPAFHLRCQLERMENLQFDGIKIGMLATAENVEVVCDFLQRRRPHWVILDPVFRSSTGASLLDERGMLLLSDELLPLVDAVTPNLDEAAFLIGSPVTHIEAMKKCALMIWRGFDKEAGRKKFVVIKGGHLPSSNSPTDIFFDGTTMQEITRPRIPGGPFHGTGCRFSAALLAQLVQGEAPLTAVTKAKEYLTSTLSTG